MARGGGALVCEAFETETGTRGRGTPTPRGSGEGCWDLGLLESGRAVEERSELWLQLQTSRRRGRQAASSPWWAGEEAWTKDGGGPLRSRKDSPGCTAHLEDQPYKYNCTTSSHMSAQGLFSVFYAS